MANVSHINVLNEINKYRAGRYIPQQTGYEAFRPAPLPPTPPIAFEGVLVKKYGKACLALGRLNGAINPDLNPSLFAAMAIRKEAVVSSQIEGTQASLDEVLELESRLADAKSTDDTDEVIHLAAALNYGIERIKELPLSLRLIREMHEILMQNARGKEKEPGEFRRSQNWIGARGATLKTASFVPPALEDMKDSLANLEQFLHSESDLPDLIKIGLAHVQFETIHPFLDGNGRIGRILISLLLHEWNLLTIPVMHLSTYLKQNQLQYYGWLMTVREFGDWEGWLQFFLDGVESAANETYDIVQKSNALRLADRELIAGFGKQFAEDGQAVFQDLLNHPYTDVTNVRDLTGRTFPAATRLIEKFVESGILQETTGNRRNRVWRYENYIELFR